MLGFAADDASADRKPRFAPSESFGCTTEKAAVTFLCAREGSGTTYARRSLVRRTADSCAAFGRFDRPPKCGGGGDDAMARGACLAGQTKQTKTIQKNKRKKSPARAIFFPSRRRRA